MTVSQPPKILRIAVPAPLRQTFDYLAPKGLNLLDLLPGTRVRVPFQRRELIGVFLGFTETPEVPLAKLKPALEIIDQTPVIPPDILELCLWAAEYYHHPIGEVLTTALPVLLRQGKDTNPSRNRKGAENTLFQGQPQSLTLNDPQQAAIQSINASQNQFNVFLLDGVTGSGKTEVYLQTIANTLNNNQQVLVLVPEIGLTPQTINRFRERFDVPIAALHSKLTNKQRLDAWREVKEGKAKIVIGTRSAIFSAFENLGLIIIDEEHDLSFKQQDGFRYHARDLAVMRAHFAKIPIVLGSATPSLEVLHKANQGRYQHLKLPERAGFAKPPTIQILDIRNARLEEGLSPPLLEAIKTHLNAGNQVMLFLNRRGFAPVMMCHACGWMSECKRCDKRMTYHQNPRRLHCHHCDSRKPVPVVCESCKSAELHAIGLGTERLESALEKHFPEYSIARIDRDSTSRKGQMEELLDDIQSGQHQILIGTQMLAKGHHFPNVTLVAIIDADSGFFSSDFRALERMGQLLLQVAGRAGRVEKPGTVLIQTRHPDHPLLRQLVQHGYPDFAGSLLEERAMAILPPYTHFALFRAEAQNVNTANQFLTQIKKAFANVPNHIHIMGPIPAPMPRRAGYHRSQLLVQSNNRAPLHQYLNQLLTNIEKLPTKHKVRWSLDVDPLEMF